MRLTQSNHMASLATCWQNRVKRTIPFHSFVTDRIPVNATNGGSVGKLTMMQKYLALGFRCIRLVSVVLAMIFAVGPAHADVITYYHNDLLGSPRVATNASGQVVWSESYTPHGERLNRQFVSNKIWYTSRHQDDDTGLVYMGARYYDPLTGRFIGVDPKRFYEDNIHSFNRYSYANNNPLSVVDPDGRNGIGLLARCLGAPASCITPFAQAAQSAYARIQVTVGQVAVSPVGQIATSVAAAEVGTPTYQVTNVLATALRNAKPVEDAASGLIRQFERREGDLLFLFRRDFGEFARGKEDHWNVQVMMGKGSDAELSNIHVVVENGVPVRAWDSKKVWNEGRTYDFKTTDDIPR
jgi:RHS repeat-associated protein